MGAVVMKFVVMDDVAGETVSAGVDDETKT